MKNKDEMEKCHDNPIYFYNTYLKQKEEPDLTEEELNHYRMTTQHNRRCNLFPSLFDRLKFYQIKKDIIFGEIQRLIDIGNGTS